MRRCVVLFLTLFAMLWQTLAVARVGSTVNALIDIEHTALHWQQEGHHHHEDGSYHLDDSNESVQHLISDQVSATVALLVSSSHDFALQGSAAPGDQHEASVPEPALEGLLRPPRSRS